MSRPADAGEAHARRGADRSREVAHAERTVEPRGDVQGRAGITSCAREEPGTRIPGEAGLWVLIFGDLAVFGFMFAAFLAQRIGSRALFARSQLSLDRGLGALNTGLLLTSSMLVVLGISMTRADPLAVRRNRLPLVGALLCAAGFAAVKAVEYTAHASAGQTPSANVFFTYYFVLTGVHLLHVVIGSGGLLFLLREMGRPEPRLAVLEGGAVFWHMVDLLWIFLFALLYLLR